MIWRLIALFTASSWIHIGRRRIIVCQQIRPCFGNVAYDENPKIIGQRTVTVTDYAMAIIHEKTRMQKKVCKLLEASSLVQNFDVSFGCPLLLRVFSGNVWGWLRFHKFWLKGREKGRHWNFWALYLLEIQEEGMQSNERARKRKQICNWEDFETPRSCQLNLNTVTSTCLSKTIQLSHSPVHCLSHDVFRPNQGGFSYHHFVFNSTSFLSEVE